MRWLDETQRGVVFEAIKDQLPQLIKTASDFSSIISGLNKAQLDAILEVLKDKLPQLIKTADDFTSVMRWLDKTQCGVVFEAIKDQLPQLIKTASDFSDAIRFLNEAQRGVVFEAIKDQLPQLIKTASDFSDAIRFLNEAQRGVVFEAIKDRLSMVIKSAEDFVTIVHELNYAKRIAVFQSILLHTQIINDQFINQKHFMFDTPLINSISFLSDRSSPPINPPQQKIQLLHQHFYDLFTSEEHRAYPNVQYNRRIALKLIKNEILHILKNAKPKDMSETVFKQAEQFLLLSKEVQSAVGGIPEQDPLTSVIYLRYKRHYDKSDVDFDFDLDAALHAAMAAELLNAPQTAHREFAFMGTMNGATFSTLFKPLPVEYIDRPQSRAASNVLLETQHPSDYAGHSLSFRDHPPSVLGSLGSGFAMGHRAAAAAHTSAFFAPAAATHVYHAAIITTINNVTALAGLLERFSESREDIYQQVMRDENFHRITHSYPEALSRLVRLFPAHKEDFYNKINTNQNFDLFTHREVEELANLVQIFPEHKEAFYNRVNTDLYFRHFSHTAADLGILIRLFSEHEQALRDRFNQGSRPTLGL
jgi:hypothetical protein